MENFKLNILAAGVRSEDSLNLEGCQTRLHAVDASACAWSRSAPGVSELIC